MGLGARGVAVIRLITARRLRELVADLRQATNEVHRLHQAAQVQLTGKLLAEQARDHFQEQAEFWKARATRFIDQAHLKAGNIDSPVMGEATPAPASAMQGLMSALNKREIRKHKTSEEVPPPAAILGVDEAAARAAVAGVFDS